jgi:hypothetical protein
MLYTPECDGVNKPVVFNELDVKLDVSPCVVPLVNIIVVKAVPDVAVAFGIVMKSQFEPLVQPVFRAEVEFIPFAFTFPPTVNKLVFGLKVRPVPTSRGRFPVVPLTKTG